MRPAYDLFIPGDYFVDLIYTGLPQFPALGQEIYSTGVVSTGGGVLITVLALHRLRARVGWGGCFGDDYYSDFAYQFAQSHGVDLTLAKRVPQPYRRISTSISLDGERAFVTYVDPLPIDLLAFWLECMASIDFRHLHLGGLVAREKLAPLSRAARGYGATISMDSQDVPVLHTACEWRELLSLVDVFMPNAREAMIITQASTVPDAIRKLMDWTKTVIVKDGANGAWLGTNGTAYLIPGIDSGPVADTTGAGDNFNAGFLYGYVIAKADLERCVRYGNICGGISVTAIGGTTLSPSLDELHHRYRSTDWARSHKLP